MTESTGIFEYASEKTSAIITIIFTIIAGVVLISDCWGKFYIIGVIFFIVVIFALCCIKKHRELIEPEYIEDSQKINEVLVNYLKDTKKSLYYFGGAGFITANEIWATTLANKLKDPNFKVVRIIDLKKPDELEPLLRKMYGEKVDDQIADYRRWIKTHAEHLKKEDDVNNSFYSYEGAPIWKHGMNYIVFDKKILALIMPSMDVGRKVAIIKTPKIAEELADSITSVVRQFKLKKLSGEDLEKVYLKGKTE